MFILFDVFYLVAALFYFPYTLIKRKWHSGMSCRLGKVPEELRRRLSPAPTIWIHAVSVGEVMTILDLIKRMKVTFPTHRIVCSSVTQTGYRLAAERLAGEAEVIFAPLDFSWAVRRYAQLINPVVYVATETEIWPNLFTALQTKGVPIVVVNGRISDRSYRGYRRLNWILATSFKKVKTFAMQSLLDADRVRELGVPAEKVQVIGNLKFDQIPNDGDALPHGFSVEPGLQVFIAGSTHPGEEEIILRVFRRLQERLPWLRLIIAPRHIERAREVMDLVTQSGFQASAFSKAQRVFEKAEEVVVVDEIGRLRGLYALATIVFIGKTFAVGGGQNMIEPAAAGKAVFLGPQTYNFKDVVETFLREKAMVQVQTEEELFVRMSELLMNSQRLTDIGRKAKQVVTANRGATQKTLELISQMLDQN